MTLLASIESLFETYDCPYFKKPPTMIETILIPQQLTEWVHQIYFQQKKLNQLAVVKLVEHPLESVKPNIACSIMYSIIKEKVEEVCQHIRSLISLSYKKLKSQKQTNCDLKHQTNSWNMNFKRFKKQNHDSSERKIWGPIGHLICAYHNYLLDANKEVYDLWKLLYQCSQVKDLQFKTLQNTLNQTILDELMKQFPSEMNPREIMPTLSSFQKHDFIFKQMWGFQKRKIVVQFHPKQEFAIQQKKTQKISQIFNSFPKKVQKGQALQPEKPIALPKSEIGTNTSIKSIVKLNGQTKLTEKQVTKKKAIQQELKFLQIQEQIQQLDSTAKLKILQKILTTMKDTNQNKDPMSSLSTNLLNTLSPSQLQFLGRTIDQNQIKQNEALDKYCQDVSQSSDSSSSSDQQILVLRKGENSQLILQKVKQQPDRKKIIKNTQLATTEELSLKNSNDTIQNPTKSSYVDYFQKSDLEMERRLSETGRDIQDKKNQFMNYLKFKLGTTIFEDKDGKVSVQTVDPDKMHPIFDQICQIQANQRFGMAQQKQKKLSNASHINAIEDKIKEQKKQLKVTQKTVINKSKPIQKKQKPVKIHHADDSKYQQNFPVGQDKQHHKMQDVADRLYELAKQRKKLIQQNAQLSESKGNLSKTLLQYLKQKHQNTKQCTVQYEQSFKCYLDNHPCTVTSKKMKIDTSKLPFQWAKQLDGDGTSGFFQKTKNRLMDQCFKFQTSDRFEKIIDEPEDFQTDKQTKKKKKNKKKNKKKKNQDKNGQQSVQKEQDIIQQSREKKQMINRCEIEQIMQEQEEIQKQREQQLLMEKKIAQYQCKPQSKTIQEKNKKPVDKKSKNLEQFNQSELSLFTFLQSLQIKDQSRQKCVVTQDNLKNFCKKASFIRNKKNNLMIKSLSQRQSIKDSDASSYKISSYNDFSNFDRKHDLPKRSIEQLKSKLSQEKLKQNQQSLGQKKVQSKAKPNPKKKAKR